jgi:hypothetical protein
VKATGHGLARFGAQQGVGPARALERRRAALVTRDRVEEEIAASLDGPPRLRHLRFGQGRMVLARGGERGLHVGRLERLLGGLRHPLALGVVKMEARAAVEREHQHQDRRQRSAVGNTSHTPPRAARWMTRCCDR